MYSLVLELLQYQSSTFLENIDHMKHYPICFCMCRQRMLCTDRRWAPSIQSCTDSVVCSLSRL